MNQLDAVLVALAHRDARAVRTASVCHRRLAPNPLAIVLWQLGSEPFAPAAIGFGQAREDLTTVVAGDPRNRDLAFAALLRLAAWFNPRFERPASVRDASSPYDRGIARSLPQVLVPNRQTVDFLGRLGRRLAYLPTTGDRPADPALVRLGQHLLFLGRYADEPGQQLVVPMAEVVAASWATPQTPFERASFSALEAFVEPPAGMTGFQATALAELYPAGPAPVGEDERPLDRLVTDFNEARADRTDPRVVQPLLEPIARHYAPLVERTWRLMWRALERERSYPEARSVGRRWDDDRREYTRHVDWTEADGRRRTRQSARQAIATMRRLEERKARLIAEEALDDPLRMIPFLLDGNAIEGRVEDVDRDHKELASVAHVRRPLVTIRSDSARALPVGKELWWTESPGGRPWAVHATAAHPDGGTLVTLKLTTGSKVALPVVGSTACFSVHNTAWTPFRPLPKEPPWPLRAPVADDPKPIESDGTAA